MTLIKWDSSTSTTSPKPWTSCCSRLSCRGWSSNPVVHRNGEKAEDYWSQELKQYIDLHTKTPDLPPLSDDLQCPICFEIMDDVHIIPQCCHRFCKECITDAFNRNSKHCPICRMEYSIGEVRRDPLLCKFAILAQEKNAELAKAKEELATLKRKYNEIWICNHQLYKQR